MYTGLIIGVLLVFILNVIGNSLNTIKTIFLAKNIIKPTYIIVFIDAVIFFSLVNQLSQGNSFIYVISYALGKTTGTWLGNTIEKKMALGIVQISLYAKCEKAIRIADAVRERGYSVTTYKGYGNNGNVRFEVNITLKRKEVSYLQELLRQYNINDATMIIRDVSSINGKITVSSV